jgi:hypothetical protein
MPHFFSRGSPGGWTAWNCLQFHSLCVSGFAFSIRLIDEGGRTALQESRQYLALNSEGTWKGLVEDGHVSCTN